jgi:hypothetical protein
VPPSRRAARSLLLAALAAVAALLLVWALDRILVVVWLWFR